MKLRDKETRKIEELVDKTKTSFLVTRTKLSKEGINCTQWFTDTEFNKKFEIITKDK